MSSYIVFVSTALSLGAAWFYFSPSRRQERKSPVHTVMTATAGLHALFVLWNLVFYQPPNLFARLGISINAPVDHIRSLLVREAVFNMMGDQGALIAPPEIPKDVETLLTRLGANGGRDMYVRFGQRAIQTCSYCSSADDYTLFVLSSVLLDYLRTATVLLFLTINLNGRRRARTYALFALACAFFAEFYAFSSASAVPLEKGVHTAFMWHDNLFLARNVLFLGFPVLIQTLLAVHPPPSPSAALASALGRLERTLPRAQLLRYFRQAVLRHPYTRKRVVEFWANDAADGAAARNDPNVQMTASKLGFGFAPPTSAGGTGGQESVLRVNARMVVQSLKPFFAPPAS